MNIDPSKVSDRPLPPTLCEKCGNTYTPKYLKAIKKWANICPRCAVLNLARVMEEESPGMSLREISDGEQVGAFLRSIVETPNP